MKLLIISDVNMPNMDGISMVQELRKLPDFKFTPILMLTTESSTDMKMKGKAHIDLDALVACPFV